MFKKSSKMIISIIYSKAKILSFLYSAHLEIQDRLPTYTCWTPITCRVLLWVKGIQWWMWQSPCPPGMEGSRKTSISALLTMPKPLTVWITINCGKFWKRWEYQTTWPGSWETYMQVRKQQLELDMEQQSGSKLGKEYVKAIYCHPAYLT